MKTYEYSGVSDTYRYLNGIDTMPERTATPEGIKRARDSFYAKLKEIHRRNDERAVVEPQSEPQRNIPRKLDKQRGYVKGWSELYG